MTLENIDSVLSVLEQKGGHPFTPSQAAGYLGFKTAKGPFSVEIGSAKQFGLLESPERGKIQPTEPARQIPRPKNSEDQLTAYREAVLKAPGISEVYTHYRGESIPQDTFFKNTLVDTFGIPEAHCAGFSGGSRFKMA